MPADFLERTITDDLDAGETGMGLSHALGDSRLCLNGAKRSIGWIHRAANEGCIGAGGGRIVLETININGRKVTTKSAIARFIRRQSQGPAIAGPSPRAFTQAAPTATAERLARAGI